MNYIQLNIRLNDPMVSQQIVFMILSPIFVSLILVVVQQSHQLKTAKFDYLFRMVAVKNLNKRKTFT